MDSRTPRIFADFNNADEQGRLRLNTLGSLEDLERQQVRLSDGLAIVVYDGGEFVADAAVRRDQHGNWVAQVDWSKVQRLSQ